MRRRSRAGGEPVKARRRRAATLKRRNGPKTVRRNSSAASQETKVAPLTRERDEALEQQTATSEILASIGGSMTDPKPVFEAIVRNLLRVLGTPLRRASCVRRPSSRGRSAERSFGARDKPSRFPDLLLGGLRKSSRSSLPQTLPIAPAKELTWQLAYSEFRAWR
jgi:hypothetical protein